MKILDLGCGVDKTEGAVGVDINLASSADIIHDLNTFPYPMPDNEFDLVICNDVMEHVGDVIRTMEEIHRVAKNGALVRIRSPFASSKYLWLDPTHRRGFMSGSFDYFVEGTGLCARAYSKARFQKVKVEYEEVTYRNHFWDKLLLKLANRFKDYYETRFMFIYPIENIYFTLKVVK